MSKGVSFHVICREERKQSACNGAVGVTSRKVGIFLQWFLSDSSPIDFSNNKSLAMKHAFIYTISLQKVNRTYMIVCVIAIALLFLHP